MDNHSKLVFGGVKLLFFAVFSIIFSMELEDRTALLEAEVEKIKQRNQKVEADKAWETSNARKFLVVLLTYLTVVIFMFVSKIPSPWLNAIVPAAAFVVSTLTLPFVKKIWIKKFLRRN